VKIGVFDSGIGGITVLTELKKRFGFVDFVYLGDTAHVPYGTKSPSQIERLSLDCAKVLKSKGIDAFVVACNTASSWALTAIEELMAPLPVFGVVVPGVEAVLSTLGSWVQRNHNSAVLVLATKATVQSHAYGRLLRKRLDQAPEFQKNNQIPVLEQACPLLVPMIEEGWIDHPILHQTILEYVSPYVGSYEPGVALLGCTHYPWIHSAFEKAMPGWKVVNSAWAVAESLQRSELFQNHEKLRLGPSGTLEWIFTDPEAVSAFAKQKVSLLSES
jgi:glutamate racemase